MTPDVGVKLMMACIASMVDEANSRSPGAPYSERSILEAVAMDPLSETAAYLRNGFAAALKWYGDFERNPELFDVFPGKHCFPRSE